MIKRIFIYLEEFFLWKTITFKYAIEKVNFKSLSHESRESFLKILQWYYLLELEKIPQKTSERAVYEQSLYAKAILKLYNDFKNVHTQEKAVIEQQQRSAEESKRIEEWKSFLFW